MTNQNHNEINAPENINGDEEENNLSNTREEQIVPEMRIGPRRSRKILTSRKGRSKKQLHMIPIGKQEVNQENQQEEHLKINQAEIEEQFFYCFEYAGITEKGDPHTAKEAMSTPEAHE